MARKDSSKITYIWKDGAGTEALDLLDLQVFDVHLTTLLTYLGAFTVLVFSGKRQGFGLYKMFLAVLAVMIPSVVSFEIIWIPLNSLLTHSHFYGASSLGINMAIITFSLGIAKILWKHIRINWIFFGLLFLTGFLWLLWLPSFAANSTSRFYADPIKIVQTATIIYPFTGKK